MPPKPFYHIATHGPGGFTVSQFAPHWGRWSAMKAWHHDICSCDGASQTKWLSDTRAKRKGWSLLKTDVILALRFGDRRLIGHLAAEQAGFSDGTSKSDVSKASFKWFWQTHIADCEIHILLSMEYLSSFVHFPVHLFQAGSFQKQICWKLLCLWWIW